MRNFLLEIDDNNQVIVTMVPAALKIDGSIELGFVTDLRSAFIIVEAQASVETPVEKPTMAEYVPLKQITCGQGNHNAILYALDDSGMPWQLDLGVSMPRWVRLPVPK